MFYSETSVIDVEHFSKISYQKVEKTLKANDLYSVFLLTCYCSWHSPQSPCVLSVGGKGVQGWIGVRLAVEDAK